MLYFYKILTRATLNSLGPHAARGMAAMPQVPHPWLKESYQNLCF